MVDIVGHKGNHHLTYEYSLVLSKSRRDWGMNLSLSSWSNSLSKRNPETAWFLRFSSLVSAATPVAPTCGPATASHQHTSKIELRKGSSARDAGRELPESS